MSNHNTPLGVRSGIGSNENLPNPSQATKVRHSLSLWHFALLPDLV